MFSGEENRLFSSQEDKWKEEEEKEIKKNYHCAYDLLAETSDRPGALKLETSVSSTSSHSHDFLTLGRCQTMFG